jgi:hypothetical protein
MTTVIAIYGGRRRVVGDHFPHSHRLFGTAWQSSKEGLKRLFPGQIACQILMVVILVSSILAPGAAHADWWSWWPFGPKDYEECAVNAAKEAKSKDALAILLSSCELQFRGRRKPTGGYTLYDNRQNRYFDIKGPNPTPAEAEYIERQHSAYISAQAEYERLQQVEAERQSGIRRAEAERQRVEAERQATIAQIAKAEFQRRQQTALPKIEVTSQSIECPYGPTSCGVYKLTIGIRNRSQERISALSLGWVFLPADEPKCPTSVQTKRRQRVELSPNGTTAINIDGYDGPGRGQFLYCVQVTGAEIVP